MSKLNEIEDKLSRINDTTFHKLVDTYLNKKYHYNIQSIGTKLAEDKPTKGTPDTLIPLDDGRYIFVEYTAQKTNIVKKFLEDISKCFDVYKTGIDISKIDKIILACNSKLSTKEIEILNNACNNITCEILTNSSLSYDIHNNFPIIAKNSLDVEIDTGQILDEDDFVKTYDSSKYTTPLNIEFLFREEESKKIISSLDTEQVILITGKAGVGKTKLALEVGKKYADDNGYTFKCILERGSNIFDDIKSYFHEDKYFLIFIDDANRIHTALTYLKEYYSQKLTNGSIKLILTVRDYAKTKVIENLENINFKQIDIKEFSNEEIRTLVKNQYDIQNTDYLKRIENLSKGNPRLALMIAKIAKEKNTLMSINNVSNVYDEYFSNIFKESNISNETLKVAAIISFFRVIDRSNDIQMNLIKTIFGLDVELFWNYAHILHEQELCDFYENEVVKISDQVVSTYLFYYVVFKKKLLNIELFIEKLFFDYPRKMNDILVLMMNSFDSQKIQQEIQKPIDNLWENNISNKDTVLLLMQYFWYIKETDTLDYCKTYIDSLEKESLDADDFEFIEVNNLYRNDEFLDVLSIFINRYNSFKMALQIILEYFETQPNRLKEFILPLLTKNFSYSLESHKNDYFFENILFNELWIKTQNGKNILFTKLYLETMKYYLKLEVDTTRTEGKFEVSFIHFSLYKTNELELLRQNIWENLFELFKIKKYKSQVLNVINKYILDIQRLQNKNSELLEFDSNILIVFLDRELSVSEFIHCKMIQKYFKVLEKHNIDFPKSIQKKFMTNIYLISQKLDIDRFFYRKKYDDVSWEKIEEIHKNDLKVFIQPYQCIEQWSQLLEDIDEIYKGTGNTYKITNSLNTIILLLAEENETLFNEVFKIYLTYKDLSSQCYNEILENIIGMVGKYKTYNLLKSSCIENRECWLFSFYNSLSVELIDCDDVKNLLKLYLEAKEYVPYHFGFLEKYLEINENVIYEVSKILYDKSLIDNKFLNGFGILFNSNTNLNNNLLKYFKNDISLLKQIYITYDKYTTHGDYDCESLNKILDMDASFMVEYIETYLTDKDIKKDIDYHKDMRKLWERDNYEKIITLIIETYIKYNKIKFNILGNDLLFLFSRTHYHSEQLEVQDKQKDFLLKYIKNNSMNIDKITYMFDLISHFSEKQKKEFISTFINSNSNPEHIHEIIKEPSFYGLSGSAVVYWNERKEYYISLLELFNGDIKYIKHKQYIENRIKNYELRIKSEKKREFIED